MLRLNGAILTILRKPGFTEWNATLTKFVKPTFKPCLSVIKLVYCSIKSVYQDKLSLSSIKSRFNAKTLHYQVYHGKTHFILKWISGSTANKVL